MLRNLLKRSRQRMMLGSGSPMCQFMDVSLCDSGTECARGTRVQSEPTVGFWYRFYQGPKGRFQFGVTYFLLPPSGLVWGRWHCPQGHRQHVLHLLALLPPI